MLGFTSDGTPFGALTAPFDRPDLRSEGTGYSYTREGANTIVALDPLGNIDTTFGVNGLATVPGINMRTFKLLNSGDIIALGTSETDSSALALARIAGSFGTALQPPAVDTTKFVPVPPKRILDTRDGTGAPSAKLGVGAQIDLQIAGVAGVPGADVSAVVLNVTATEATQAGFVSVYPSGTRRPTVSNLNLRDAGSDCGQPRHREGRCQREGLAVHLRRRTSGRRCRRLLHACGDIDSRAPADGRAATHPRHPRRSRRAQGEASCRYADRPSSHWAADRSPPPVFPR